MSELMDVGVRMLYVQRVRTLLICCGCAVLLSCADSDRFFAVDFSTNYISEVDFASIRVSFRPIDAVASQDIVIPAEPRDYARPLRIATFEDVDPGVYMTTVQLLEPDGAIAGQRRFQVELTGSYVLRARIDIDCRGVECPVPGGSAAATECLGGSCVPPTCIDAVDCGVVPSDAGDAGDVVSDASLDTILDAGDDGAIPDAGTDGGVDAPVPCTLGPWGTPTMLTELSSPGTEWGGYISPDGLEVLFGSDRSGGAGGTDIYRATRSSTDEDFGTPAPLVEINTSQDDDNAYLTPDGRTLYFDIAGRVHRTSRDERGMRFGTPEPVDVGLSGAFQTGSELSHDGTNLFLAAGSSVAELDLFIAPVSGAGFDMAQPQTGLSSGSFDCCVTEGPDGMLLFTSTRASEIRIWEAVPLEGGGYEEPRLFSPLSFEAVDAHIQQDGRLILFSMRGPSGDWELATIERSCL